MLVQPDFSEVTDAVGPGEYSARIIGATPGEWSTGTKYINWSLETYAETEAKNNGRRIFYKTPIAGKGAFRLQQFYRAAMKQDLTPKGFDTEMILGKEVKVTVVEGSDKQGNPTGYPEVRAVKPV